VTGVPMCLVWCWQVLWNDSGCVVWSDHSNGDFLSVIALRCVLG
jgi:hypothetical protein